ncbi:hypothetical protein [Helicobacter rodentium]|nr:hypothetical protein [Helicobacter rodentium]
MSVVILLFMILYTRNTYCLVIARLLCCYYEPPTLSLLDFVRSRGMQMCSICTHFSANL